MRIKDNLFGLEDITILLQYLYMDKRHVIRLNLKTCKFYLRMTEDYHLEKYDSRLSEFGWIDYTDAATIPHLLKIIALLKIEPSKYEYFESEWEEIRKITEMNVGLNLSKQK